MRIAHLQQKTVSLVTAFVFSLAALLAVPPAASADTASTSCRRYDVGITNQTAYIPVPDGDVAYWYTTKLKIPYSSSSTCRDINITNVYVPGNSQSCVNFRVRFYPTSGGSWRTGWKYFCPGTSWKELATDVMNGTTYQIEAKPYLNANYRPYYTIFD